ncbi:hypothetical protein COO60DRAFT_1510737 [Scenedesmus sp. NREL 46B-D3]|nr:hypothetical protein COO60DRAFT_1510737 [Scenedesmus sp. NREL 46B-D3]
MPRRCWPAWIRRSARQCWQRSPRSGAGRRRWRGWSRRRSCCGQQALILQRRQQQKREAAAGARSDGRRSRANTANDTRSPATSIKSTRRTRSHTSTSGPGEAATLTAALRAAARVTGADASDSSIPPGVSLRGDAGVIMDMSDMFPACEGRADLVACDLALLSLCVSRQPHAAAQALQLHLLSGPEVSIVAVPLVGYIGDLQHIKLCGAGAAAADHHVHSAIHNRLFMSAPGGQRGTTCWAPTSS